MRYQGLFRGGQRIFWILCALAIAAMIVVQVGKALKNSINTPENQESCNFEDPPKKISDEGDCDLRGRG